MTVISQGEQKALPERTGAVEQTVLDSPALFVANPQSAHNEQSANTGERIRSALESNPHLTDRELAELVGVAPSTANKWRKRIEQAIA